MICTYPQYKKKTVNGIEFDYAYPCGQCLPCRVNKRRQWTSRMLLESLVHPSNLFITLTNDEEHHETSVSKQTLQKFFKRLRKQLGKSFRYFAVGEYGDTTNRAHYHAILFGLSLDDYETIEKAWGRGFATIADFTTARASYCAGYTIKKLTKENSIPGKSPEFALMSRRPGVGLQFIERIVNGIKKNNLVVVYVEKEVNGKNIKLPQQIRLNNKLWPLDHYMKTKLSEILGQDPNSEMNIALRQHMRASVRQEESLDIIASRENSKLVAAKHNRRNKKHEI